MVEIVRKILARIFEPGLPCIYDLLEEVSQALGGDDGEEMGKEEHRHGDETAPTPGPAPAIATAARAETSPADPAPPWTLSPVLTEKKSIFLARAAPVTTPTQARTYLTHLLTTDKKAAKATHNISAWRIRDPGNEGIVYQDCDDDGETAAGGRLLKLLQVMDVWGVVVVVSRWYGGVKLGPDRFRLINEVAREALVLGGWGGEGGGEGGGGKRKGKR